MNQKATTQRQKIQNRIAAAQGKIPCDLIIKNVRYLDVFHCQWRSGDVAVADGAIVGLESGLKAKKTISGKGKWLVPGFIDAHVHVESSLLTPENFEAAVLARGTTTAVCDPHELTNVMGSRGLDYFLTSAEQLDLNLQVMLSSCVPATQMETNGGGVVGAKDLLKYRNHPHALGLAEMMNVPGVLNGDDEVLQKIEDTGLNPVDGHCPLLTGKELSAYAVAGISSCHESSYLKEAQEKLTKGIAVWIREGSVAKDLEALIPILNLATSTSVGFCTDDRNPLDIVEEGHVDYLIRQAIKYQVAPEVAYRAASWSVARHYGLHRGPNKVGAIAPGYLADFVLLDHAKSCDIHSVYKTGRLVKELNSSSKSNLASDFLNTVKAHVPSESDLKGPVGRVNVIGVQKGKIITDHLVMDHDAKGVAKLTVLERHGNYSKPANAYVFGFGKKFQGAIASSVGHDSHNLIVVGSSESDMRIALAELIQIGGGFSVVQNGKVTAALALPLGGLMSLASHEKIEKSLKKLHKASHAIGCELPEPFLQLAFLSLPVIPHLKLTDKGLVDVNQFRVIPVKV